MIDYDPEAGCHIHSACTHAIGQANLANDSVRFTFNGVTLTVQPGDDANAVQRRWNEQFAANAEAYRNSPEGRAMAERQRARAEHAKAETARLVSELPGVLADGEPNDLMRWLYAFTEVADHIEAKFDTAKVADRLEAAGYREHAHEGLPQSAYEYGPTMREYIVGQVINCLRQGMPPHPMTRTFIEKYAALPGVVCRLPE